MGLGQHIQHPRPGTCCDRLEGGIYSRFRHVDWSWMYMLHPKCTKSLCMLPTQLRSAQFPIIGKSAYLWGVEQVCQGYMQSLRPERLRAGAASGHGGDCLPGAGAPSSTT